MAKKSAKRTTARAGKKKPRPSKRGGRGARRPRRAATTGSAIVSVRSSGVAHFVRAKGGVELRIYRNAEEAHAMGVERGAADAMFADIFDETGCDWDAPNDPPRYVCKRDGCPGKCTVWKSSPYTPWVDTGRTSVPRNLDEFYRCGCSKGA